MLRDKIDEVEQEAQGREQHEWERAEAASERARAAESQLRECKSRAAADRVRLVEAATREVRQELEEAHRRSMDAALRKASKEADKREWRQMEAAKAAAWRAERAEARLAAVDSGAERRAAERVTAELADEAAAAELARARLEAAHARLMREAAERERRLREALDGAEARLRGLEAELAAAAARERDLQAAPAPGLGNSTAAALGTCPAAPAAPAALDGWSSCRALADPIQGQRPLDAPGTKGLVLGSASSADVVSGENGSWSEDRGASGMQMALPEASVFASGSALDRGPEGASPAATARARASRSRFADAIQAFQRWSKSLYVGLLPSGTPCATSHKAGA